MPTEVTPGDKIVCVACCKTMFCQGNGLVVQSVVEFQHRLERPLQPVRITKRPRYNLLLLCRSWCLSLSTTPTSFHGRWSVLRRAPT